MRKTKNKIIHITKFSLQFDRAETVSKVCILFRVSLLVIGLQIQNYFVVVITPLILKHLKCRRECRAQIILIFQQIELVKL